MTLARPVGYMPTEFPIRVSAPQSLNSSLFGFFGQRSFRRLIAILGLGSAVAIAYTAWSNNFFEAAPADLESEISEVKDQSQSQIVPEETKQEQPVIEEVSVAADHVNENIEVQVIEEPKPKKKAVTLFQLPRGFFAPCISPFGLRLETFLRVAKIDYDVEVNNSSNDAMEMPWIRIDDQEIKDYTLCIKTLCNKFHINLNYGSTSSRKTAARFVDVSLESRISWGIALWRWVYDEGRSLRDIQGLVPSSEETLTRLKQHISTAAHFQGMGRQTQEEVTSIVIQSLTDITAALGKHPYFLGNSPGEVDCNAFSLLAQMVWNMPGSPFERALKQHKPLMDFVIRMRETFWPDWEEVIQQTKLPASEPAKSSLSLHFGGKKRPSEGNIITKVNPSIQQTIPFSPTQQILVPSFQPITEFTNLSIINYPQIRPVSAKIEATPPVFHPPSRPQSAFSMQQNNNISTPPQVDVHNLRQQFRSEMNAAQSFQPNTFNPSSQFQKREVLSTLHSTLAAAQMFPHTTNSVPTHVLQQFPVGTGRGEYINRPNPVPAYEKPSTPDADYYEDLERATKSVLKHSPSNEHVHDFDVYWK